MMNKKLLINVQNILGYFHNRKSNIHKDIYLFSSQRSGSTLMMNLFGTQRNIRCVSEPLFLEKENPPVKKTRYIELNKDEEIKMIDYFQKLSSGEIFRISKKVLACF